MSTVRQLEIGLLHHAVSELMGPLYRCTRTSFEMNGRDGRK